MEEKALDKLTTFFAQYKPLLYRKKETIIRADDEPQGIYFLTKGTIRVYSISKEGEELTLLLLKAYDFFPVRWAVTYEAVRYTYQALTPAQMYRVPRDEFLAFLKENPDVFFAFSERIFVRLGGLMKRLEYIVFGNADAKVAAILQMCLERFGREEEGRIHIELPLTHKDIASLVGMVRETVSIAMEKLTQQGIISQTKGHIIVYKKDELMKILLLEHLE